MYGQGGGGGATAAGGNAIAGSGQPAGGANTSSPQAIKSQIIEGAGMGIQLGLMNAQKRNLEADAAKKEADAAKTAGIDTELAKTAAKLNEAKIENVDMSTEEIAAKAKMWGDTSTMLWQQARKYASEADYNEKTMDTRIEKAGYETMGSLMENMETIARTEFTKAQTDAIAENIATAWYNAATNRMNAATAADHVANELFKTTGELDIKQKQLLKDWIYQGVHAGMALLEGVTDLVKIKALRKYASEADYNEKTLDTRIEKAGYETMGSLLENMETIARTQFTKAQTDAIAENIATAWYNAATNRMNATTAADHVANELFKTTGELDIKQKQLLKDWIYQGVHAGIALLEGVTDLVKTKALIKAASKGIKEVVNKRRTNHGKEGWSEEWIKEVFRE